MLLWRLVLLCCGAAWRHPDLASLPLSRSLCSCLSMYLSFLLTPDTSSLPIPLSRHLLHSRHLLTPDTSLPPSSSTPGQMGNVRMTVKNQSLLKVGEQGRKGLKGRAGRGGAAGTWARVCGVWANVVHRDDGRGGGPGVLGSWWQPAASRLSSCHAPAYLPKHHH